MRLCELSRLINSRHLSKRWRQLARAGDELLVWMNTNISAFISGNNDEITQTPCSEKRKVEKKDSCAMKCIQSIIRNLYTGKRRNKCTLQVGSKVNIVKES